MSQKKQQQSIRETVKFNAGDVTRAHVDALSLILSAAQVKAKLKCNPALPLVDAFLASPKVDYALTPTTLAEARSDQVKQKARKEQRDAAWCALRYTLRFQCPVCAAAVVQFVRKRSAPSEARAAVRAHIGTHGLFANMFCCPGKTHPVDGKRCATLLHTNDSDGIRHHWYHVLRQHNCILSYFKALAEHDVAVRTRVIERIVTRGSTGTIPELEAMPAAQLARHFADCLNNDPKTKHHIDFDVDVAHLFATAPAACADLPVEAPMRNPAVDAIPRAASEAPSVMAEVDALLADPVWDVISPSAAEASFAAPDLVQTQPEFGGMGFAPDFAAMDLGMGLLPPFAYAGGFNTGATQQSFDFELELDLDALIASFAPATPLEMPPLPAMGVSAPALDLGGVPSSVHDPVTMDELINFGGVAGPFDDPLALVASRW
ncbi:hypothetical protein H9P43_006382 [Blastocladiella emersonii ATCC 22665]|nr:hypothetical protein H9P43_006382 [Blastocladiella emersonii ATCC 22665]